MLRRFVRRNPAIARGVRAGFAALWLTLALAPCVMAATACAPATTEQPCALHESAEPGTQPICGLASVDCQLPDLNTPSATAPDLTGPSPVLLVLLSAAPAPSAGPLAHPDPRDCARAPPFTPLNLRHAVLLI